MKGYKLELREIVPARPAHADGDAPPPKPVRYRDLLELVLRTAPPLGWQPGFPMGVERKELKRRNALRRDLAAANGALILSVEQAEYLRKLVEQYHWTVVSFEAEQFCDDLETMPAVELTEKGA